jgi:hypothetical protein
MNRELLMTTLLERLRRPPLLFSFTAGTDFSSKELTGVSDTSGLRLGMPVFGSGIPVGAVLETLEPTITMSKPANTTAIATPIGQGCKQIVRKRLPAVSEIRDQPAMFLVDGDNDYPGMTGTPSRRSTEPAIITLRPQIFVYTAIADPNAVPATPLNALLDALETLLVPGPQSVWENLGLRGVVHGRIEGKLAYDGGHQNGQAGARIPLAIQVMQGIETVAI